MKPIVAILSVLCLALAVGLILVYNSRLTPAEKQAFATRVAIYSNQVEETRSKLGDEQKLSLLLQSNLTVRTSDLTTVSNQYTVATNALSQAEVQARDAQAEAQKLTARVTQVETERDALQTRLNQLAKDINSLNDQITETKRKLAAAEGDREFLTKELVRLQSDKAELVRQFNDVAAVRAQLAMLREEIVVNQRMTWMSQGIYQRAGMKGAQALLAHPAPMLASDRPSLDVELHEPTPKRETPETVTPPVRF